MKRTDIKRRPLADTVLASLEPEAKEYRETYGVDRIYFVVSPNGRKRWELRYKKANGKWSFMGLGGYPEVSAKKAREKAGQAIDLIDQGVDPVEKKVSEAEQAAKSLHTTFRAAAETWYEKKSKEGLAQGTLDKVRTYLDKDILPALGDKQLDEISRRDCADLQQSFERRDAHNVAKKARGWLNKIFSFAIASGLTENNPASELLVVAAPAPKTQQYPHLLEPELPEFMRAMRNSTSRLIARTAAWMTLWTASRPGMVRYAEWKEIDLDGALWSIPGDKMKMKLDHVVPLCTQLVAALRELHELTGRSKWLFPGIGSSTPVISENTIGKVFASVGYKGRLVGHGTRHTASTLLREHEWSKDFVEAQLAHKEAGVSGVYNKAAYLRQRRKMMQWYADYLDALEAGMAAVDREQFRERIRAN
ncbi:tyrosine-type recombinase/integrase [Pseudomonas putida]|uniref:tyrosine-type recombinase/integrase n=1 Tax=Pseudomonas putida TaxID=303 RepID=UPI00349E50E4